MAAATVTTDITVVGMTCDHCAGAVAGYEVQG